ncbi:MAG TPA: sugar ABC transporter substrate-binding protein, partial [Anaerolineae bacterium]|nr:sugar ABC transporter substrate-binding protein [Anaerolineae bacterium]
EVVPEDQVNVKLETALAAKQDAYDIFALDIINLPKYAAAGWVAPLDTYMSDQLKADVLPFAQQAAQYQGHWLGLPFKAEFMSFIYNKKMLQDAGFSGPPKTLDELIQQSVALKEKGIVQYPIAFTWGAGYEQITVDWVMFVKALGGDLFDKDGKPVFNQGAGVAALQLMNDMLNKYKIVDPAALTLKGGGTRRDIVMGGKAAFVYLWSSPLITMNDPSKSSFAGDFASALAPAGNGGPYSVAGPEALSISAYSKNKDAAWEFIQCLAGPAGEKELLLKEGDATGYKSVLNDPEVTLALQKAGGDVQAQQALFLAVRPALPYYSEWSADVQQEVQNVLTGQKTAQAALDDLAKATTDLQSKFK